jgi:hypothetical protein
MILERNGRESQIIRIVLTPQVYIVFLEHCRMIVMMVVLVVVLLMILVVVGFVVMVGLVAMVVVRIQGCYRLSSKVEWIRNVANTTLSKPRLLELIQALVTDNPGSALIMGENPRNGSSCGIFLHWASRRLGCCQIVDGAWDDKDSERRRWGLHAASRCLLLVVPIASLLGP